jgi:UPF0755 protein
MRFFLVLVVLGIIAAGIWVWTAWDAAGPAARSGAETVVLIPAHSRTRDIAQMLEQKGLIRHAILFEVDARLKGVASRLKAGEYAIPSSASMGQIASILVEGRAIQHSSRPPKA